MEEEWDPWLESECRIGKGGTVAAGFNLCKMHILLSSGWGTGISGGICNIGNSEGGGIAELRNGVFVRWAMKGFKLVYGFATYPKGLKGKGNLLLAFSYTKRDKS